MKILNTLIVASVLFLVGCSVQQEMTAAQASAELNRLMDTYMARAAKDNPYFSMLSGKKPESMPDYSFAGALDSAKFASGLLKQADRLSQSLLSHEEQLSLALLRRQLQIQTETPEHYWLQFQATPYQAGLTFSQLPVMLALFDLSKDEDRREYLDFIVELGDVFSDYREQLIGQRERGIYLPKPAIDGTHGLYQGLMRTLPATVIPASARLESLSEEEALSYREAATNTYNSQILPALEALLKVFNNDYVTRAPSNVGLSQYPGGLAAYRHLIRRETTTELGPDEIHQLGLKYMALLREKKAAIREHLGFAGTEQEFKKKLLADPRFYAKTPAEVEQRYRRYMTMIEPKIDQYFSLTPKAEYGFKRLNSAAEASVTFGYYGAPTATEPKGYYHYNGSKLGERNMIWTQGLVYHETVPGHHFHLALQRENDDLPEFRKKGTFIAAFNEGWANYAASLADEMGIMNDPYDRYGWLLFNSFITSRLVVDTGMNALGWSREQAMQYMAENTFESDLQIASETIRYSTSIPAQALAYKLGLERIWEIRREMEKQLGDEFDIKRFHAAAVGSGALPMPLLEWHIKTLMLNK